MLYNAATSQLLLPSSAQGLDERDIEMFESRAAQADLISLGMRGGQTRY